MYCRYCGKEIRDNSAFCAYCGQQLSAPKETKPANAAHIVQSDAKKFRKTRVHNEDKREPAPKKAKKSIGKRIVSFFVKLLVSVLLLAVLAVGTCCALVYFDIVEIPVISDFIPSREEKASEETVPETEDGSAAEQTEETTPPTEDPAEVAYRNVEAYCAELASSGDYAEAVQYLEECAANATDDLRYTDLLNEYKQMLKDSILVSAEDFAANGQYLMAIRTMDAAWDQYADQDYYEAAVAYRKDFGKYTTSFFAAGRFSSVLLHNGSVEVCGETTYNEQAAATWSDIIAVSTGDRHVVGLKADGTVVAAGESLYGQCNVSGWQNVEAISAGDLHTVGLLADGSIVAVGYSRFGQCDVNTLMANAGQQRIVSVAAGYVHTLALLEDGRVLACGDNSNGACNVSGWTDIVAIYAGTDFSAGLKSDGTVVVTGLGTYTWDVSGWTDLVALSAGDYYLVGLRSDGTVLSVFGGTSDFANRGQTDVSGWSDIVFIAAGNDHTIAMTSSGELLTVGSNRYNQCALPRTNLYG